LECGGKRVLVTLVLRKGERDTALDCGSGIANCDLEITQSGRATSGDQSDLKVQSDPAPPPQTQLAIFLCS
jgi:hypothetical protein